MKKIFIIFLILLFQINIAKAANDASGFESKVVFNNKVSYFNKWLFDNGYSKYVTKKENKICANETKFSQAWYLQKCDKFQGSNNLKIKFYKNRWQVHPKAEPNRDTLIYYLWKTIDHIKGTFDKGWSFYEIKPSDEPYEFKSNLREDKFVKKQLKKNSYT